MELWREEFQEYATLFDDNSVYQSLINILRGSSNTFSMNRKLMQKVIDEEPRFRDFFVPRNDNTKVNNLMTDEVLNGNDIAVVCRHPVTYRYGN